MENKKQKLEEALDKLKDTKQVLVVGNDKPMEEVIKSLEDTDTNVVIVDDEDIELNETAQRTYDTQRSMGRLGTVMGIMAAFLPTAHDYIPTEVRSHKPRDTRPVKKRVHSGHTIYIREDKVGRNSPCPCGSGKKHKHCCYE